VIEFDAPPRPRRCASASAGCVFARARAVMWETIRAAFTSWHMLSTDLTRTLNRECSWQARVTSFAAGPADFAMEERIPLYGACGNPACKAGKHSVDLCASDACPLARDGVHHAVDVGCAACLEHPKPSTDSWRPMQSAVQEFLGIPPALASQLQLRACGSCHHFIKGKEPKGTGKRRVGRSLTQLQRLLAVSVYVSLWAVNAIRRAYLSEGGDLPQGRERGGRSFCRATP